MSKIHVPKFNCRIFIIRVSLTLTMFRKILTHLIILAFTVLPVQVISASIESTNMKVSMEKTAQAEQECMHASMTESQEIIEMTCCDDQSHECQSCNNCPQAASAMFLPSPPFVKTSSSKTQKYSSSYLFLNGVPQKNLLRPPRNLI